MYKSELFKLKPHNETTANQLRKVFAFEEYVLVPNVTAVQPRALKVSTAFSAFGLSGHWKNVQQILEKPASEFEPEGTFDFTKFAKFLHKMTWSQLQWVLIAFR